MTPLNTKKYGIEGKIPNHSHAWQGSWKRPMELDEDFEHPFTIARMTNHRVRGVEPKSNMTLELNRMEGEGGGSLKSA